MELSPIPTFLYDCLFFATDGTVSEADSFKHLLSEENKHLVSQDAYEQKKVFIDFYQFAKKHFDLRWVYRDPSNTWLGQTSVPILKEQDIFDLTSTPNERIQVHAFFDIPVYWFDQTTRKLGKSLMPQGCHIVFYNSPDFCILVYYEYFLFTNHLYKRSVERIPGVPPLYFEPAAKLNRDLLRNFAKAVEEKFPMLYVEFSSEVDTKPPYDKYGFPDDADDFYHQEESNNSQ
jgi:hypothetical protein